MDSRVEFANFHNVDLTFVHLQTWETVFVADYSFPIKSIVHILFTGNGCQNGDVLGLYDHVYSARIGKQQQSSDSDFATDNKDPIIMGLRQLTS